MHQTYYPVDMPSGVDAFAQSLMQRTDIKRIHIIGKIVTVWWNHD